MSCPCWVAEGGGLADGEQGQTRPRVDAASILDELLVCRLDQGRKVVEPCTLVIFGASGISTARKLVPALYHLFRARATDAGSVPDRGFARRPKTDEAWRAELREALDRFSRTKPVDEADWVRVLRLQPSLLRGRIARPGGVPSVEADGARVRSSGSGSQPPVLPGDWPSQFGDVVERLSSAALLDKRIGIGRAGSVWWWRSRSDLVFRPISICN